jgi:addiction module HigA family antidote
MDNCLSYIWILVTITVEIMETTRKIYREDELIPFEPTHPGEILKEELESRGISQRKFAEIIGIQYTALNEIVNRKRSISTDFAIMLEAALGIDAIFWVNLQTRYNMQTARKDSKLLERIKRIRRVAAIL